MSEARRLPVPRLEPEDGTLDDVPPAVVHPPLPDDDELARIYAEGNRNGDRLTFEQLADLYGVSTTLVHRKVTQPHVPSGQAQAATRGRARTSGSRDPLVIEQGITRSIVNALKQAEENLGRSGMLRILATAEMHLGLREPPERQ